MITIHYDARADAVSIDFISGISHHSKHLDGNRRIDYSHENEPVGVILHQVSNRVLISDLPNKNLVSKILHALDIETVEEFEAKQNDEWGGIPGTNMETIPAQCTYCAKVTSVRYCYKLKFSVCVKCITRHDNDCKYEFLDLEYKTDAKVDSYPLAPWIKRNIEENKQ